MTDPLRTEPEDLPAIIEQQAEPPVPEEIEGEAWPTWFARERGEP